MKTAMTARQKIFVREYLLDLNATQAAIRAGYSAKSARAIGVENLTKPVIKQAVIEAMDARQERVEITQDYVLQELKRVVEVCATPVPLLDEEGAPTGIYKLVDASGAIRGLELLGKHMRMFTDKVELAGKDGGAIVLSDMEVAGRIAGLLAVAQERQSAVEPD